MEKSLLSYAKKLQLKLEMLKYLNLSIKRVSAYSCCGYFAAIFVILSLIFGGPSTVFGDLESFPEPNPPKVQFDDVIQDQKLAVPRGLAPSSEWPYHKTLDSAHPDANEQQLMWLMNRARANPTAEGIWLATVEDPRIISAINFFKVDLDILQNEFATYDPKPPAAFDVRLYHAARSHSEYLISIDGQNHDNQFDRIADENFVFTQARGNVFSYSKSALYGHAAFNIDWGAGDNSGMQPGRGHRLAIMSIDGEYTNVGLAVVNESNPSTEVGPLVITGNYCKANTSAIDHHNRFLVGTVWTDTNNNSFFDLGEGIGGVRVTPDHGTFYAITSDGGGYAIPLTEPGVYEISFSGDAIEGELVETIMVGDDSVLLDLQGAFFTSNAGSAPSQAVDGDGGGGGGCFVTSTPTGFNLTKILLIITIFFSVFLIGPAVFTLKKITE